jgi:sec-independent protein translocase protein TatA
MFDHHDRSCRKRAAPKDRAAPARQTKDGNMGNLGIQEMLVIFVIALIVFGPTKLPEIGKSLGKGIAEFKKASSDLARAWEEEAAAEKKRESPPVDKPSE